MRVTLAALTAVLLLVLGYGQGSTDFPAIWPTDSEHIIRFKTALQHHKDLRATYEQVLQSDIDAHQLELENTYHGLGSQAASGFGNPMCDPGFTGADCEYPICNATNHHDHGVPPSVKVAVDFFYSQNATQYFYVYFDLTMHGQEFQLSTSSGTVFPQMTLIDPTGKIIPAREQENGPTQATYSFFYTLPGVYKVQLNGDNPAANILVMFNAYTYLTTEIGGIEYDGLSPWAKQSDYPTDNYTFHTKTPTIFVASPVGLDFPGSLSTISFFRDGGPAPHNVKLLLRYGCHFMYYSGEFACNEEGYYFARVRGYDFEGHTFVRSHSYVCEIAIPPPTTTANPNLSTSPQPTGPVSCFNGGVPITQANGTQYCYCPGLYDGNYCGTPLCMNGGEARGSICICADGFSGSNCQNVNCEDNANSGFLIGNPMPVFIIRTRTSMKSVITQVKDALFKLLGELSYDQAYISRFGLVTFNNNQSNFNSYYKPTDLIAALSTAASTQDSSGNCTDILFGPIMEAIASFMITNKSPIYIITDGVPNDMQYLQDVYRVNSYIMSPINFLFIEPTAASGCPMFDYESPGFRAIIEASFRFSGIASFVTQDNQANVGTLFYTHMAHTYHKAHLMFSDDQRDCSNVPSYIPISVDALFHELAFVVEGQNMTLQLNDPTGAVTQIKSYSLGGVNIFWLAGLQQGIWTATVIQQGSRNPCSVRAYAVETPSPDAIGQDYHMVYAITNDMNRDGPERQPLIGIPQSIVAHIENYPLRDASRLNAELLVFTDGGTNTGARQLVMASNGLWRSGCSYELYFPPFFCLREGINLYFTIFVKDYMGNQIQRAGVFFCAAIPVTPAPSPGTCANGGVSTGNGTGCLCQPGWQGPYCTTRVCYNSGTLDPAGYCRCPPGTGGESCEYLRCIEKNERTDFSILGRHMMFVLDITSNNAAALADFSKYISEIVRDIGSTHRDWIRRYYIVGVNSTGSYDLGRADGGDTGAVQSIFDNAAAIARTSTDNSPTIQLYNALTHHLYALNENSFINVFTYGAADESDLSSITNGYEFILMGNHRLNVFVATDASGNYKAGNETDWTIMRELADLTTGQLFKLQQSNFYVALKLFPTWYSSSLVYYKAFSDCSVNASIFAPVDTYTQSIQVYITGANAAATGSQSTLVIQSAKGNVTQFTPILTDAANQMGVFDVRKPCDSGWDAEAAVPYCNVAINLNVSWTAAQKTCADEGGFLVDDLNPSKDDWIAGYIGTRPTWLSLNSMNGTWVWDRGNVQAAAPLNGTGYTKWANNDGSIDPNKPCVYRNGADGLWYKSACDSLSFFVCTKFQFSQDFQPSSINDDDLVPGRWQINYATTGACTITVKVQSSIQVFSMFATHLLEDYGFVDGISNSTDNRAITHLVGVAAAYHVPYLTNALVMDGINGTLYRAATYEYRINCAYEYLSQNFTCPNSGNTRNRFDIIHMGEDEQGLPFQRITSGICQAPRTACRNGLFYNGQCVCDEYYSGIFCEVPFCVNGGSINTADNTCQCSAGYTGPNCQFDLCFNNSNAVFSIDNKTFIVVLELTTQNQAAITNFGSNLTTVLNAVAAASSSSWFSQYILLTFDANGPGSVQSASSIGAFVTLYNQATANPSTNNNCALPLFQVVTAALAGNIPPQSVMYLITTGGASDADSQANGYNAFNAAANTDVMINYILINNDACANEVSQVGSGYASDMGVGSDGNVFLVDAPYLSPFTVAHLPTVYNGSVLGTPTLRNNTHSCQELIYFFPVGIQATTVYLYVYAEFGNPSIVDPSGNSISTQQSFFADNNLLFYKFQSTGQGIYSLSISDPGVCMVQVRLQGGVEIYPAYIPVPATNPDAIGAHLDGSTAIPQAGVNLLALHIANEQVEPQYARLWPPHNSYGEIQYIQLYQRSGCSYEWYSDSFSCDEDGYFITLFGIGNYGAPFTRHFYTRCNGFNSSSTANPVTIPTGNPPTTPMATTGAPMTTSPGQTVPTTTPSPVSADIVFVFDVSSDFTAALFGDVQNFVLNALKGFSVGYQKGVQVGMFAVTGDFDQFANMIAGFNSILDYTSLGNALKQAQTPDDINSGAGNAGLVQALKQSIAPQFTGTGYRNSTGMGHVIIYITKNNVPNTPAIQFAATILGAKTYSILTIAYQSNGGNTAGLTSLVGGNAACAWSAPDVNSLTVTLANKLAANINSAYAAHNSNFC